MGKHLVFVGGGHAHLTALEVALDGWELKSFTPNPNYMLIMNMGDGKGIMWKKNPVLNGRLLKDFIDKGFMSKFQVSGELQNFSA